MSQRILLGGFLGLLALALWLLSTGEPAPAAPQVAGETRAAPDPNAVASTLEASVSAAVSDAAPVQRAAVETALAMPVARADGVFVSKQDGSPVAGVQVLLSVYRTSEAFERRVPSAEELEPYVAVTGDDGKFAFEVETDGEMRGALLAYHPDYNFFQAPVYDLEPGHDLDFKRIALAAKGAGGGGRTSRRQVGLRGVPGLPGWGPSLRGLATGPGDEVILLRFMKQVEQAKRRANAAGR